MKFLINQKAISWNKLYSCKHWTARKALVDEWHEIVIYELVKEGYRMRYFDKTVDISIIAHCRKPIDPDNICAKIIIDPLKGRLFKDDSCKYINSITLKTIKDKNDFIEVIIK